MFTPPGSDVRLGRTSDASAAYRKALELEQAIHG
jgi:Flp pilus assembly protein TadD